MAPFPAFFTQVVPTIRPPAQFTLHWLWTCLLALQEPKSDPAEEVYRRARQMATDFIIELTVTRTAKGFDTTYMPKTIRDQTLRNYEDCYIRYFMKEK